MSICTVAHTGPYGIFPFLMQLTLLIVFWCGYLQKTGDNHRDLHAITDALYMVKFKVCLIYINFLYTVLCKCLGHLQYDS